MIHSTTSMSIDTSVSKKPFPFSFLLPGGCAPSLVTNYLQFQFGDIQMSKTSKWRRFQQIGNEVRKNNIKKVSEKRESTKKGGLAENESATKFEAVEKREGEGVASV